MRPSKKFAVRSAVTKSGAFPIAKAVYSRRLEDAARYRFGPRCDRSECETRKIINEKHLGFIIHRPKQRPLRFVDYGRHESTVGVQLKLLDIARLETGASRSAPGAIPGKRPSVCKCAKMYTGEHILMSETLSIRVDAGTKKRLDALSQRLKRSKSFLAAEAIAAYVESEEWQLGELQAGMAELDSGQEVSHEKVSKWLKSWGKPSETKAPK